MRHQRAGHRILLREEVTGGSGENSLLTRERRTLTSPSLRRERGRDHKKEGEARRGRRILTLCENLKIARLQISKWKNKPDVIRVLQLTYSEERL